MAKIAYSSILVATLGLLLLAGCSKSKDELVSDANIQLWRRQPDQAIELFQKALAMDPDHFDSHRGLANAYGMKKQVDKQEHHLLKSHQLAGGRESDRRLLENQLEIFYLERAEESGADNADAYEEALRSAIRFNSRSKANTTLSEIYIKRAEAYLEDEKHQEAAREYQKIETLMVPGRIKEEAENRANLLLFGLFKETFEKAFEETYQEHLVSKGHYNARDERFVFGAEVELPEDLEPSDPELDTKAAVITSQEAYVNLLKILAEAMDKSLPDKLPPNLEDFNPPSWNITRGRWVQKPKVFGINATVSKEDGVLVAFLIHRAMDDLARANSEQPEEAAPTGTAEEQASKEESEGGHPAGDQ